MGEGAGKYGRLPQPPNLPPLAAAAPAPRRRTWTAASSAGTLLASRLHDSTGIPRAVTLAANSAATMGP